MAPSRIFSGIQPTGDLHLGNYFGAVRNWVELQKLDAQTIYCVVDYHAITGQVSRDALPQRTLQLTGDLLACGIDPDRSIVFVQSHVPQHTELAWVFSAFAAYGDLTRMTQFKDKSSRSKHISAGLFTYPVLQAADILLYLADGVPVGEDQSQHLELTRGIARRFNSIVGEEFFPEVETLLTEGKRIMSLVEPERKMSKSLGEKHYVGIMEPPKRAAKKIRSAVTDTGGEARNELSPGVANLIGLLKLAGDAEAAAGFEEEALRGDLLYGHLKVAVADRITELLGPIQERRAALTDDAIREILSAGAERATAIAGPVMERVRDLVGVGARALAD